MKQKQKAVLIVCDGMGDIPVDGLTPLQMAKKPNMDELARTGISGLMYTIAPGIIPGSDTAHLAIFGYDPRIYYKGRGAFEALGAGISLKPGDVAFRCNFATVGDGMMVVDRRAGRSETGIAEMAKLLDNMQIDGTRTIFRHSVEHRAALVIKGSDYSNMVGNTDPHQKNMLVMKSVPLDGTGVSKRTAEIVNEFVRRSHEIPLRAPAQQGAREIGGAPGKHRAHEGCRRLCRGSPPFLRSTGSRRRASLARPSTRGLPSTWGWTL